MWHAYVEGLLPLRPELEERRGPDGRFPIPKDYPAPPGDETFTWFVIRDGDAICGFVLTSDCSADHPGLPQPVFEFDEIFVDPQYRGRRLASAANRMLIERLRPGTLLVFVLEGNAPALNLVNGLFKEATGKPPIAAPQSRAAGDPLDGTYFAMVFDSSGPRSVRLIADPNDAKDDGGAD
jgi:GNAT superfamily N-acetyltransferase